MIVKIITIITWLIATTKVVSNFRLPINISPRLYTIVLDLSDANEYLNGNSTIDFEVIKPTNLLILHASDDLVLDEKRTELIDNNIAKSYKPVGHNRSEADEFYIIIFAHTLEIANYSVHLVWTGSVMNLSSSLQKPRGLIHFGNYDRTKERVSTFIIASHFEPIGARTVFPCWDEPNFKAEFEITMVHSSYAIALSNMPVKGYKRLNGKTVTYFERTPKLSTYLVSFIVATDYAQLTNIHGNVTFYTAKNDLQSVEFALQLSENFLKALENFTGIPYALPKIDQVSIPNYVSGGMEHWGLITYRKRNIEIPKYGMEFRNALQIDVGTLVAHELTHQWFGNLVTLVWWNDLWLNEAMATYLQHKIIDQIYPNWHSLDIFRIVDLPYYFKKCDKIYKTMVWMPNSTSDVRDIFDNNIYYSHGAALLQMLDSTITENIFHEGIRRYLRNNQFSSVTTNHLWNSLQEVYDEQNNKPLNITNFMEPWLKLTGFPILNIKRDYKTGVIHITQRDATNSSSDNIWNIPLNYATKSHPDFSKTTPMLWMKNKNITITNVHQDDWIIFNIQQTGFYQVNCDDEENWKLIVNYLHSDDYQKIHQINRAQIILDAVTLYRKNSQNLNILINVISYLHREMDRLPWLAARSIIEDLMFITQGTKTYKIIIKFISHLIVNFTSCIGIDNGKYNGQLANFQRDLFWWLPCECGNSKCLDTTRHLFKEFIIGRLSPKSFELFQFGRIVAYGMQGYNDTIWQLFMSEYEYLPGIIQRQNLWILSYANSDDIREKVIALIMTKNSSYSPELVHIIIKNTIFYERRNIDWGLKFFEENFDNIKQYFTLKNRTEHISSLLKLFPVQLQTSDQFDKFNNFIRIHRDELKRKYRLIFDDAELKQVQDKVQKNDKFFVALELLISSHY